MLYYYMLYYASTNGRDERPGARLQNIIASVLVSRRSAGKWVRRASSLNPIWR